MNYRDRLFAEYSDTHVGHLDPSDEQKVIWFREHVAPNYLPRLPEPGSNPSILEVGCNKGYMLAVLREHGYNDLVGVDLSGADLDVARSRYELEVHQADAVAFMLERPARFDVIIAKAILEHVEKSQIVPFLNAVGTALKPGGRVIIEVPNMDWLFAQHERYLDFTHEVGFTRESLAQVLRIVFGNAAAYPMAPVLPPSRRVKLQRRLIWPVVRRVMMSAFALVGEGGQATWWDVRSIMGIAEKQ